MLPSSSLPSSSSGTNRPSWRLLTPAEVKKLTLTNGSGGNAASSSSGSGGHHQQHHHHSHLHHHHDRHNPDHHSHDGKSGIHIHSKPTLNSTTSLPRSSTLALALPMHSLGMDTTPLNTPTADLEELGIDRVGSGSGSGVVSGSGAVPSTINPNPNPTSPSTHGETAAAQQQATASREENSRTLCVRHQSMADQGINGMLQQVSL
jgi:hypothetical protein